jgi:hypothetical protein
MKLVNFGMIPCIPNHHSSEVVLKSSKLMIGQPRNSIVLGAPKFPHLFILLGAVLASGVTDYQRPMFHRQAQLAALGAELFGLRRPNV